MRHLRSHALGHPWRDVGGHLRGGVLCSVVRILLLLFVVLIGGLALDARDASRGSVAARPLFTIVVLRRLLFVGNGLLVSLNELVCVC